MTIYFDLVHLAHLRLYIYPICTKLNDHFNARFINFFAGLKFAIMYCITQIFSKRSPVYYVSLEQNIDDEFLNENPQMNHQGFIYDTNDRFHILLLCNFFFP